jgi:hypothetical protein
MRTAILLALLLSVFGLDRLRGRLTERTRKIKETSEVYTLPPPAYVKAGALGYHDAAAAILWAQTLYTYGEHVAQNRAFSYAPQYLGTILALDPNFRPAYRFASTLVTMQAVAPPKESIVGVRAILAEGTRTLPTDPDVWGAYATYLLFEGAQFLSEDEKRAWRIEGAKAAAKAVELGFRMDDLSVAGASYLERFGERELAIAHLSRAYAAVRDPDVRARIERRLDRLRGDAHRSREIEVVRLFEATRMRELPFVDPTLAALVGPSRDVAGCAGRVGIEPGCGFGWSALFAGKGL